MPDNKLINVEIVLSKRCGVKSEATFSWNKMKTSILKWLKCICIQMIVCLYKDTWYIKLMCHLTLIPTVTAWPQTEAADVVLGKDLFHWTIKWLLLVLALFILVLAKRQQLSSLPRCFGWFLMSGLVKVLLIQISI